MLTFSVRVDLKRSEHRVDFLSDLEGKAVIAKDIACDFEVFEDLKQLLP
jgi:hypothetical protein